MVAHLNYTVSCGTSRRSTRAAVNRKYTWGDSDVILSAVIIAAMLEAFPLQQCNIVNLCVLVCLVCL